MVNTPHLFFANMPKGVTPISHQIYNLHMEVFFVCLGIGIIVFTVLTIFLIKYRKKNNVIPENIHSNSKIELIWSIVPLILLIAMAVPATIVLMRMNKTAQPALNIKITGYQWKWRYEYLDYDINFFSNLSTSFAELSGKKPKSRWYLLEVDQPLVVPIHQKIRFLVTSHDVIHSWWVPALGIKRDAIPGFIYESWAIINRPGIYRGQCAELCGVHHAFMPIVVEAKTEADFNLWVKANRNKTLNNLSSDGQALYESQCGACHKSDGSGMPPTFPALRGSKVSIGPIARHIDIVINGEPGTAMPAFGPQLTDEQIAAIITYERNSWGNNDQLKYGTQAGGIIQPNEIKTSRSNLGNMDEK